MRDLSERAAWAWDVPPDVTAPRHPRERGRDESPKGLEGGGEAKPTVTVVLDEPLVWLQLDWGALVSGSSDPSWWKGGLRAPKGFPGGSDGKESAWNAGDLYSIPGLGRSPGEGNGYPLQYTHSSILAWRIPWTEEPGRLQSMGLQRVGCNWVTNTHPPTPPTHTQAQESRASMLCGQQSSRRHYKGSYETSLSWRPSHIYHFSSSFTCLPVGCMIFFLLLKTHLSPILPHIEARKVQEGWEKQQIPGCFHSFRHLWNKTEPNVAQEAWHQVSRIVLLAFQARWRPQSWLILQEPQGILWPRAWPLELR